MTRLSQAVALEKVRWHALTAMLSIVIGGGGYKLIDQRIEMQKVEQAAKDGAAEAIKLPLQQLSSRIDLIDQRVGSLEKELSEKKENRREHQHEPHHDPPPARPRGLPGAADQ